MSSLIFPDGTPGVKESNTVSGHRKAGGQKTEVEEVWAGFAKLVKSSHGIAQAQRMRNYFRDPEQAGRECDERIVRLHAVYSELAERAAVRDRQRADFRSSQEISRRSANDAVSREIHAVAA